MDGAYVRDSSYGHGNTFFSGYLTKKRCRVKPLLGHGQIGMDKKNAVFM
jgi:hypothetical protein